MVWLVWAVVHNAWRNIIAINGFFDKIKPEDGIDWTIFRLGSVQNGKLAVMPHSVDAGLTLRRRFPGSCGWIRWGRQNNVVCQEERAGAVAGGAGR